MNFLDLECEVSGDGSQVSGSPEGNLSVLSGSFIQSDSSSLGSQQSTRSNSSRRLSPSPDSSNPTSGGRGRRRLSTSRGASAPRSVPSRRWVVTIPGVGGEPTWNPDRMRFLVYQLERGSTTDYEHYQCYVVLNAPARLNAVRELFPATSHCEPARGTHQQCIDYCTKTDTRVSGPWQHGDPGGQGSRTDLSSFVAAVRSGRGDNSILDEFPVQYLRYARHIVDVRRAQAPQIRNSKPLVIFLYGATGVGKSRLAHELIQLDRTFFYIKDSRFFDGYFGQPFVIFDDIRVDDIPFHILLRLTDRYPFAVPQKGIPPFPFTSSVLIFTSAFSPDFFVPAGEDPQQLLRRLDFVIELFDSSSVSPFVCSKCPSDADTSDVVAALRAAVLAAVDSSVADASDSDAVAASDDADQ